MFYSKSLLSKKGPLGSIWVAAFCYKKLKKEQVSETNISSTIDKIIPDVQLSYRVLAHLLLGVVRIFSKKVDYLFRDCNEILIKLGKTFLTSHRDTSKEATEAHHHEVSLPKEVTKGQHHSVALHAEDIHASIEALRATYNDITITLPKNFELDSFDLEVPEENTHEQFRLEEDEFNQCAFVKERHSDEMIARSDFYSGCFTPIDDVISPGILDINLEVHEPQQASCSEVSQKLLGDPRPLEECGNHSSARRYLKLDMHSQELEEKAEEEQLGQTKLSDVSHASHATPEGYAEVRTPVNEHGKVSLLCASEAALPEFAVTTPAIKERRWVSRKRKCFYDETVVLSNQILRQWIHDGSSLICKRRKVPHTFLDAWKAKKLTNIENSLMEPLILPVSDLKAIFFESFLVPSGEKKSVDLTHGSGFEKTKVPAEPEQRDGLLEQPSVEVLPSVISAEVPSFIKLDEEIFKAPFAMETSESVISFINREFSSVEGERNNQDGWSIRTRSLARYLCHLFDQEGKGAVSLAKILKGKGRSMCAKFFYETLVLKSRGFVDVEQALPFGDITVSATPVMETMFKSNCASHLEHG